MVWMLLSGDAALASKDLIILMWNVILSIIGANRAPIA